MDKAGTGSLYCIVLEACKYFINRKKIINIDEFTFLGVTLDPNQ